MATLDQELALLKTRGLVRAALERGKPFVRFKHALTYQATYNSILQSRRVELHRAAAQTLMELYPAPDLEMALTIAEHWQRGNKDARALETILPHAQNLIYTGRSISLTALLTRLRRENLNEPQQRDLDIALADAHDARGEYEPARTLYQDILAQPSTQSQRALLLYRLGVAAYHLNDNEPAIAYQRESLELAQQAQDLNLQARVTSAMGLAYWNLGDYEHAEANLQSSRALGLQLGESVELAIAEQNLAGVYLDQAKYANAMEYASHALELCEQFGYSSLAQRTLQLLGACYYGLHDLERAADTYQRAIEESRALGDMVAVALGLGNLAEVYQDWEQIDQAEVAYANAIQILRPLQYDSLLAYDLASLASVQIQRATLTVKAAETANWLTQAQTNLDEALTIAVRIRSAEAEGVARRVSAELDLACGDWNSARTNAEQAIALLQPLGRVLELERAQATQQRVLNASPAGLSGTTKEVSL